jgi:small subunit ribosomal protein S3
VGQKTNPIGFRLGIIRSWNSRWFASSRNFADLVHEDMLIKRYIAKRLDNAGIGNVGISRAPKKVTVDIHTSRPGIVIGRKGAEVDKLREELQMLTKKDILLNIVEVRKPELDAKLTADNIAKQLEGRVSFRRAMKKTIQSTMKMGAVGVKVQCGGRLGGAEIARVEKYKIGRVPLHTIRADIDYATSTANTTYGTIGVKVWICRGEILEKGNFYAEQTETKPESAEMQDNRGGGDRQQRRRDGGPGGGGGGRGPGGGAGRPGGPRRDDNRPRGQVRRHGGGAPAGGGAPNSTHGRRPEAPKQQTPGTDPDKKQD